MSDKIHLVPDNEDEYMVHCKKLLEEATPEQLWFMDRLITLYDSGIFTPEEWQKFLDIIFHRE